MATTLGTLGLASRRYVHKIPFIVKLNHNAFLHVPDTYDQIMFASVRQAADLGAVGVGATIYFGSPDMDRELQQVAEAFAEAHRLGMFTVLWCYLRNSSFKKDGVNYEVSADLTGQANHMGVTIEADIIKQKQPENNGGYTGRRLRQDRPARLRRAHHRPPDRPHPLAGRQLLRRAHRPHQLGRRVQGRQRPGPGRPHRGDQQAGRRHGPDRRAARPSSGPMAEGAALIHAIQDVYLERRGHHRLTPAPRRAEPARRPCPDGPGGGPRAAPDRRGPDDDWSEARRGRG